jgi:hypothetical protein
MEQSWLLKLPFQIIQRLIGINRSINKIVFNELFWKYKLEKDVTPPYHKIISSYRQYYLLYNDNEYGKIWKGRNQFSDLVHIKHIYHKPPNKFYAIADDNALYEVDKDGAFFIILIKYGVKKCFNLYSKHYGSYLDINNNLRRFKDNKIDHTNVKDVLYDGRDDGESLIYLKINGDLMINNQVVISNIVQGGQYEIDEDEIIYRLLDIYGDVYELRTNGGQTNKIKSNILKITNLGYGPFYITRSGRLINEHDAAIPFPVNIKKVISTYNPTVFIGYDGQSYLYHDTDIPTQGVLKTAYQGLVDLPIYNKPPIAIAKGMIEDEL